LANLDEAEAMVQPRRPFVGGTNIHLAGHLSDPAVHISLEILVKRPGDSLATRCRRHNDSVDIDELIVVGLEPTVILARVVRIWEKANEKPQDIFVISGDPKIRGSLAKPIELVMRQPVNMRNGDIVQQAHRFKVSAANVSNEKIDVSHCPLDGLPPLDG
jgi:hypothetical protein